MATELHCWFDFGDSRTCVLLDEHDGPHEPTPDNDILITLADSDGIHDWCVPEKGLHGSQCTVTHEYRMAELQRGMTTEDDR